MIRLKDINLTADSLDELHRIARRFVISKTWYDYERQCYDVICPHKIDIIINYIERKKNLNNGRKLDHF